MSKRAKRQQPPNKELKLYMTRVVARYGTARALAAKIGMSETALSRAVHREGTMSFENCVRLADAVGDDPCLVLRFARKADQARLLERIRGDELVLTARARKYIQAWIKKTPEAQDHMIGLLESLPDDPRR